MAAVAAVAAAKAAAALAAVVAVAAVAVAAARYPSAKGFTPLFVAQVKLSSYCKIPQKIGKDLTIDIDNIFTKICLLLGILRY